MDPNGGGRGWECVAESGLVVPHSLPGTQRFFLQNLGEGGGAR